MTVNLYTFVGMYSHALDAADHLLDKGAAHAAATGALDSDMLGWRLAEDMHPLAFQLASVCNFARQYPARAAGAPAPDNIAYDLDLKSLKAAIAEAKAELSAFKPEQFEGRDAVLETVTFNNSLAPTLPIERWLSVFATTNLYFHLSIAYAILRARGVPIGKADLFPKGL